MTNHLSATPQSRSADTLESMPERTITTSPFARPGALLLLPLVILLNAAHGQTSLATPGGPFLASESRSFVLENARIVDGTGNPAREGWSLAIEDRIIAALGPTTEIAAPPDAERIDLEGHTILPGLISLYEPIAYSSGNGDPSVIAVVDDVRDPHPNSVPKLLLAAGVTTARTAGSGALQVDLALARRIDAGVAVGPTLLVTGPYLSGPSEPWLHDYVIDSPEEAREVVRFWVRQGSTSVTVTDLEPGALRAAIEEAHRLGAQVAGELGFDGSCIEAARLGIDTITRAFGSCLADVPPPTPAENRAAELTALLDALIEYDVVLVYTPFAWPPGDDELTMLNADQRARYDEFLASPPPLYEAFILSEPDPNVRLARDPYRAFVDAGGRLLLGSAVGSNGSVAGYAFHRGMISTTAMFSPLEIIRMTTSDAANFLGIADRTGRVATGLEADLLIVRGAPDVDMQDVRNVAYVFKDGRAFDPGKLRDAAKGLVGLH
jgi:imidazolonepropionase-like amidohydrolase